MTAYNAMVCLGNYEKQSSAVIGNLQFITIANRHLIKDNLWNHWRRRQCLLTGSW